MAKLPTFNRKLYGSKTTISVVPSKQRKTVSSCRANSPTRFSASIGNSSTYATLWHLLYPRNLLFLVHTQVFTKDKCCRPPFKRKTWHKNYTIHIPQIHNFESLYLVTLSVSLFMLCCMPLDVPTLYRPI